MVGVTSVYRSLGQRVMKRWFDVVVALGLMMMTAPVLLLAMIWVRCVSPGGNVLYRQTRLGQFNRPFQMIKLRSMVPNAEQWSGPVMVSESVDHRLIKGGRWIRQASIDELPQLWNVLKGDMSIVGPRPERPYFVNEFSKTIPMFDQRHGVPVGITGWAQVNGRSALTHRPAHKFAYDMQYIQNWSMGLDIKICIKTIAVVFRREGAY